MHAATCTDETPGTRLSWLLGEPAARGRIRSETTDFRVDEILGFEPSGSGEHTLLEIEKRDANTRWVAWQIATWAGVREIDVGYAGRKDRHSISRQWFSCHLPGREDPDWDSMAIEGVTVLHHARHSQKLRPGDLSGNRFEILVRIDDLPGSERTAIEERIRSVAASGFPNYFGIQRFGRDNQNLEAADQLLRFGRRVRGDRGIVISAARSALFNGYLSRLIATRESLTGSGPLYGRSRDPQPGEAELDDIETAWVAGLRRLKAKADTRALLAYARGLDWSWRDDGIVLRFELDAGCFATSLFREVFNLEDQAL